LRHLHDFHDVAYTHLAVLKQVEDTETIPVGKSTKHQIYALAFSGPSHIRLGDCIERRRPKAPHYRADPVPVPRA
jgi:hypothetical protein